MSILVLKLLFQLESAVKLEDVNTSDINSKHKFENN